MAALGIRSSVVVGMGTFVSVREPKDKGPTMAHTVKKIVITALATGGIVAGVATASAAPLRTGTSMSALSAEEQQLHGVVTGLTAKELALQASLAARHHRPAAPVSTPTGAEASSLIRASSTVAPSSLSGHGAGDVEQATIVGRTTEVSEPTPTATTEPTESTESTHPTEATTTTSTTTTTTTEPTTTTTWPEDSPDPGSGSTSGAGTDA